MNKQPLSGDLKFFLGHKRPEFPLWSEYDHFGPEKLPSEPGGRCNTLLNHELLNEYAFLFELRRQLQASTRSPRRVTLCQYRRFLVRDSLGLPSKNIPWANILKIEEVIELGESLPLMVGPTQGNDFQIGPVIQLQESILSQYSRHHFCRDILRFGSDLVDSKILSNVQACEFLTQKVFIPTPSCGTFTTRFLISALENLERAAEVYLEGGYQKYSDPYQGRVVSFLLERLNSYFLLNQIKLMGHEPSRLSGKMIIVSEDLSVKQGLIAHGANLPTSTT